MYRRILTGLALLALVLVVSGCYHSIIDTGLQPGRTAYHGKWETAWLNGLIPVEVDARGACNGPWARVETQQSFLNGLVTLLTLGIYAPHEVEIICAAGSSSSGSDAPAEEEGSPTPLP